MTEVEKKKILLAESDEFLSSLLKGRLEGKGFLVEVVASGTAAVEKIKNWHPDLVILEIILPEKIGFDVISEVRSDTTLQKTSFMVLSNLGQKSDIDKAKNLGAVDYFVKNQVIIEDLIEEVDKFLKGG